MEIVSLAVAVIVVYVVWLFLKGVATFLGLATLGGLVYYMHSTHPSWIEQASIVVQNWVY